MTRTILKKLFAVLLAALLSFPGGLATAVFAADQASAAKPPAVAGPDEGDSSKSAGKKVSLDAVEIGEDQVLLKLSGLAKYNSFLIDKPSPRLVVELLDTEYNLGARLIAGKGKMLQRVRSSQFSPAPHLTTRVVFDLSGPSQYKISSNQSTITVSVSAAVAGAPSVQASAPIVKAESPGVPAAKVAIKPKTSAPAKKKKAAPAAAAAPQPVEASAPVVKTEEPAKEVSARAARVHVSQKRPAKETAIIAEAEPMGKETSRELNAMASQIDLSAGAPEASDGGRSAQAKKSAPVPMSDILSRLSRDLISMDFDGTDVRDVLHLMGAKANVNIIYGADVSGNVTLHIVDAPFSDAFRAVLMMSGLTTTQVGNDILRVAKPATLTAEVAMSKRVTRIIQVRFKKAADLLVSFNAAVANEKTNTAIASADAVSNTLIVTDTLDGIAAAERLVHSLDIKPVQILIEVKLVEVAYDNGLDLGVKWNYFEGERGKALGKQGLTTIGGGPGSLPTASAAPFNDLATGLQTIPGLGTGVNLLTGSQLFQLGRVTNNYFLNLQLAAAATQHKAKILSDPKIATLNNQEATLKLDTQLPYVTIQTINAGAGIVQSNPTIAFAPSGITLKVTPTILADGRMTLALEPTVNVTQIITVSGQTAPETNTRTAKATLIAHNGETVVMGGLISDQMNTTYNKIPFLGDLPGVGWLFKSKSVNRSRVELLIFVTPKIMQDD